MPADRASVRQVSLGLLAEWPRTASVELRAGLQSRVVENTALQWPFITATKSDIASGEQGLKMTV